ncbi:MAG: aminoacyl-tRNA hydrolase [Planctomyces sp.]|nr:aminoacyl-tRNA hydrolase [Planctomyces sp.]
MKVIVGLGNPGRKYVGTRHNVGFDVVAELARRMADGSGRVKFESDLYEGRLGEERVLLACPQTYMNLSGRAIRQILTFHKLEPQDLLIVCDDLNLPTGKLRLRKDGTAGGQKGLQNTIDQLGTQQFARLRIGIDRPPERMDATDYVLGKFVGKERDEMELALPKAADAAELWVREGIDRAMNAVNATPKPPKPPKPAGPAAAEEPPAAPD